MKYKYKTVQLDNAKKMPKLTRTTEIRLSLLARLQLLHGDSTIQQFKGYNCKTNEPQSTIKAWAWSIRLL